MDLIKNKSMIISFVLNSRGKIKLEIVLEIKEEENVGDYSKKIKYNRNRRVKNGGKPYFCSVTKHR